jgi:hypothetical protein
MAYEKVKRNRFYDPPVPPSQPEFIHPHSSKNHYEDSQEFHRPLGRMHNANLHDWGIAQGLEVSGAIGGTVVAIAPGVALNGQGELISLSLDGQGDIGSNPPGAQHNAVSVPVQLGLGSHAGQSVYVTIQFSEMMRGAEGSGGRMEQVPWIQLQPVAGASAYVNDGVSVILAIADINAAGNLTALRAEDSAVAYGRRVIGQSLSELRIQRSTKVGDSVEETTSGKIGPGVGGGLRLTVPNSSDGVSMAKEDGGNFANLEMRTNAMVIKDAAGREALRFNTTDSRLIVGDNGTEGDLIVKDSAGRQVMQFDGNSAILYIGASGNEGDIQVRDSAGRTVFTFDAASAALYLGANGNEGDLIVRDSAGAESAKIDGNTGKLNIKRIDPYGHVLDIDARYVRIHGWDLVLDGRSGGNKRALVDSNNRLVINWANDYANGVETPGNFKVGGSLRTTVNGIDRILGGNPARYVKLVRLVAWGNGPRTVTEDVDLASSRRFVAFACMVGMDPLADYDKYDGHAFEVYKVDGTNTNKWLYGGRHFGSSGSDANFHTPVHSGTGRIITFRARTFDNATGMGIGVVFYE